MMKKTGYFILALILIFSLASCRKITTYYSSYYSDGTEIEYLEDEENVTAEIKDNKVIYITGGKIYTLNHGESIFEHTLGLYTKKAEHLYYDIEQEILRLCNEERAKVGVPPLEWCEDAYYFTNIRAKEYYVKNSHTRPNNKKWNSVYTQNGVILFNYKGRLRIAENLTSCTGYKNENLAAKIVELWMNSEEHRQAILNPEFKKTAIAVYERKTAHFAAQHFFG